MSVKPFEPLKLNYDRFPEVSSYVEKNLNQEQKGRLKNLFKVIEGFESSLSLEILASTHYLKSSDPEMTEDQLFSKIQDWNQRKNT